MPQWAVLPDYGTVTPRRLSMGVEANDKLCLLGSHKKRET